MAEISIKFKIPAVLYRYRWKNVKGYVKWLLFPNKCSVCGAVTEFNTPEVKWRDLNGHTRMMGQANIEKEFNKCICQSCVADIVANGKPVPKVNSQKYFKYETKLTCDHCNQKTKSYKWTAFEHKGIRVALILGDYCSWNSAYYCPTCISKIFSEGTDQGRTLTVYRGKFVPQNNFGLPVVDGKAKFPER